MVGDKVFEPRYWVIEFRNGRYFRSMDDKFSVGAPVAARQFDTEGDAETFMSMNALFFGIHGGMVKAIGVWVESRGFDPLGTDDEMHDYYRAP